MTDGIRAHEKYRNSRPICNCHHEQMLWHRDSTRREGGRWRCGVKVRDYHDRYNATWRGMARSSRYAIREALEHGEQRLREAGML